MSQVNKKINEEKAVSAFISSLALPNYELKNIKEEEGDFLLIYDGKRISIEETRLYFTNNGISRMQFKRNCDSTVKLASEIFKKFDIDQELEVRVTFNDSSGLIYHDRQRMINSKKDIDRLANIIASISLNYKPEIGGYVVLDHYDLFISELLTEKIDRISITDVTGKWKGFFSTSAGYVVPKLTTDVIREKIASKEKKERPLKFNTKFDEFWLLITLDTFSFAGHYDLDYMNDTVLSAYNTSFNRVFAYDIGTNKLFEFMNLHTTLS